MSEGMRSPVGVGFTGMGHHWKSAHFDLVRELADARIVGGCDRSPEVRERQIADGFPAPIHADLDELLGEPGLEAVFIGTPDPDHADSLARCAAAGKHALVEKPIAEQPSELDRVTDTLRLAYENDLIVASCHPRRFDASYGWLKGELPSLKAELGEAQEVRHETFFFPARRRGLHRGELINHISHDIDLVNWLFGFSHCRAYRLYDSHRRFQVAGCRADELCFSFFLNRALPRGVRTDLVRITFERGDLELDTWQGTATMRDRRGRTTLTRQVPQTNSRDRRRGTNVDFIDAILGRRAPSCSPLDLVVNTEIGIALTYEGQYDTRESAAVAHALAMESSAEVVVPSAVPIRP